ncbi:hypothetical protein [Blastococcus sp. TF02A-35]|uniref:hypothetical protein n=1 Tax=Blastococcus sp. TF02A-35 TaxID=2559612 RepID=UPI001073DC58|nr:hypothetical protein [Blastococcus sp. TF02A_35]TFV52854.1 hypothetical protein E4P43_04450 [Blastococcus sp. TF02A_35]
MSSLEQIRRQIDEAVKKRAEADKQAADARVKQAKKEADAASYRSRADRASSQSMARSYLRQAESAQKEALTLGAKAAGYSTKSAQFSKKEADLSRALSTALDKQRSDEQRVQKQRQLADQRAQKQREADEKRARERLQLAERRAREREQQAERARTQALMAATESRLQQQIAEIRPPQVERLRILYVTAASDGDLRVDKEIRRVKKGVKAATLRDLVEIEPLLAATGADLLDGMSGFKPHVVHFAGHADEDVLVFDTEADGDNLGQVITKSVFARAMGAVDNPPVLVVLNACHSTGHLDELLTVVPMAIGMSDEIGDPDAMSFAARFYTAIADGQSVRSAYEAARIQMEMDGMSDADLPVLRAQDTVDPAATPLIIPPAD